METFMSYLSYIQVILALLLIIMILLQRSEDSLGGVFGGGDSDMGVKNIRRGGEKVMFNATIVIAILFAISTLASTLLG